MKKLADHVAGNDVFTNEGILEEGIVREYHERNERKKEDEKWLKKYKPIIQKGLESLGKDKVDVGELRVSITIPDNSHFDMDKVLEFVVERNIKEATKLAVDEEGLQKAVEDGVIDLEELKKYAWVEKKGTPRLSIKPIKKKNNTVKN